MNAPDNANAPDTPKGFSVSRFELNPDTLGYIERFANLMATAGVTVPEPYRGKPGNCAAVTIQALQWGMNPFAVASKTHFVNNAIGYEAQLIIAAINTSGLLADRLNWEWFGDWEKIIGKFAERESKSKKDDYGNAIKYRVPDWKIEDEDGLGVTCFATLKGEREPRRLTIMMKQARVRNSTLWADDPRQQIAYLSGKRWGRLHTSEVLFGVRTPDELDFVDVGVRDMGPVDEVPPAASTHASSAKAKNDAMKSRMKSRMESAAVPTLDEVLKAIADASTPDALTAAGEMAVKLKAEREKEIARTAYADKLNAAREAQHAAAKKNEGGATGEPVALTFAQVMDALEKAGDRDVLDVAADMIRDVPDEGQREELEEFYVSKRKTFEGESHG